MCIKILFFSRFSEVIRVRVYWVEVGPIGQIGLEILIEIVFGCKLMWILDVINELVGFETVVNGVWLEDPLEVVEVRSVVVIVDPSCLDQQSPDVGVLGVEDEDLLISCLFSLLSLPCLLGQCALVADHVLRGVDGADYGLRGLPYQLHPHCFIMLFGCVLANSCLARWFGLIFLLELNGPIHLLQQPKGRVQSFLSLPASHPRTLLPLPLPLLLRRPHWCLGEVEPLLAFTGLRLIGFLEADTTDVCRIEAGMIKWDDAFLAYLGRSRCFEEFIDRHLSLFFLSAFVSGLDAALADDSVLIAFGRPLLEEVAVAALEDIGNRYVSNICTEDFIHPGQALRLVDAAQGLIKGARVRIVFELGCFSLEVFPPGLGQLMVRRDLHLDSICLVLGHRLLAVLVPALYLSPLTLLLGLFITLPRPGLPSFFTDLAS